MYEEGRKAIAIYTQMVAAHPEIAWYRASLSYTYTETAGGNLADRNWSAVIENATRALPFLEENYAANPAAPGRLDYLAYPLSHMSEAYAQQGDFAHAIEIRRRLVRLREQFASLDPSEPSRVRLVAEALRLLASVLRDTGDHQGCVGATLQAIALLDRFRPEKVGTVSLRNDFGREYLGLIGQLASIHEVHASLAAGRKILGLWEDLYRTGTRDEATREWLDSAHRLIALLLMRLGNFAESLEHYQRSLEFQPPARNETAAAWQSAAALEERVAVMRGHLGDHTAMDEGLHKAIELDQHSCALAEQAWKNSPKSVAALRDLHGCEAAIMRIFIRLGDARQALEHARKGIPYYPTLNLTPSIPDVVGVRADAVLLAWQLAGDHADYTGILEPAEATLPGIRYFVAHGSSSGRPAGR
jgi:tetratricopeptide (TPR) repeat protein